MGSIEKAMTKLSATGRTPGICDSSLCLLPDMVIDYVRHSKARVAIIERDSTESLESYAHALESEGIYDPPCNIRDMIESCVSGLQAIAKEVPHQSFDFNGLSDARVMRVLHSFILPESEFPEEYFDMLKNLRVTQIFANIRDELAQIK